MSSLREDVESMIRLAYHRGSGGMVSEVTTVSECTHNIMAFIDSHIPPRLSIEANDKHWEREAIEGFNEAVGLMREEIK